MDIYSIIAKADFDDSYKVKKRKIPCYSKDKLDDLYPNEDYILVGETKKKNKKKQIGSFNFDGLELKVSEVGANSKIIYKKANFVSVGPDQYLVLLKNRWIIIIWFFGVLLGLGLAAWLIWWLITSNSVGNVVVPDNPLPSIDPNAATVVDDASTKVVSEDGGGSVTMYYSLDASISLADGHVELFFVNPNASNHSVTLELCIVDGNDDYVISTSGLIPAGMGITSMTFDRNSVALSAGDYEGKIKIYAYDELTGEKAITQMEITDLTISVS